MRRRGPRAKRRGSGSGARTLAHRPKHRAAAGLRGVAPAHGTDADIARSFSMSSCERRGARATRDRSPRCSMPAAAISGGSARRRMRCARETNGDIATYVVNRNINYTNICGYRCTFCAFSKGTRKHEGAERGVSARHRGGRAPLARGARARSDRGLPAGRHPSELHRGDLSRDPARGESRGSRRCTCTPSRRSRSGTAPTRCGMSLRDYLRCCVPRDSEVSRHGRGDSGGHGARCALPRQAAHRASGSK